MDSSWTEKWCGPLAATKRIVHFVFDGNIFPLSLSKSPKAKYTTSNADLIFPLTFSSTKVSREKGFCILCTFQFVEGKLCSCSWWTSSQGRACVSSEMFAIWNEHISQLTVNWTQNMSKALWGIGEFYFTMRLLRTSSGYRNSLSLIQNPTAQKKKFANLVWSHRL